MLDFRSYHHALTPNLEVRLVKYRACVSMYLNINKYFARVVLIRFRCPGSRLTRSLVAFLTFGYALLIKLLRPQRIVGVGSIYSMVYERYQRGEIHLI